MNLAERDTYSLRSVPVHKNGSVNVPENVKLRLEGLKVITPAERVAVTVKVSLYLKTISFSLTKSTSSKSTQVSWSLANSTLPIFVPSSASSMEVFNQYLLSAPKIGTSQLPAKLETAVGVNEGKLLGSEDLLGIKEGKLLGTEDFVGTNDGKLLGSEDLLGIKEGKLLGTEDLVGTNDGKLLGSEDLLGIKEGKLLGSEDLLGIKDGKSLGFEDSDGFSDGRYDGLFEGNWEGCWETEGSIEGKAEGRLEGSDDGAFEDFDLEDFVDFAMLFADLIVFVPAIAVAIDWFSSIFFF